MRIACPNCETSYQLADGALGATGRKVRCARCGNVWHAFAGDPPVPAEASDAEWKDALVGEEGVAPEAGGGADVAADAASLPAAMGDGLDRPLGAATIDMPPAGFEPEKRHKPERAGRKKKPGGFAAIRSLDRQLGRPAISAAMVLALAGLVAFGIFGRRAVVAAFPDLAGFYELVGMPVNLRGLSFSDVATRREMDGQTPVLVVEGSVVNLEADTKTLPNLRITLKSASGRDVYAWNYALPQAAVEAGGSVRFSTRLMAPPEAAVTAEVRFTDKRGP